MKALRLFMTTIVVLLSSCITLEYNTYNGNNFMYSKYIDGFWGDWEFYKYGCQKVFLKGNALYIYNGFSHPSEYIAKIVMYGFDDKKSREKHIDEKGWYEYTGVIEYYWNGDIPNSYASLTVFTNFPKKDLTQKSASCTIRIQPYRTYPQTFNVLYYNNKGFAISLLN